MVGFASQICDPPAPASSSAADEVARIHNADCPLCGDGGSRPAFRENGCSVRRCDGCGLFFVDPYPRGSSQHDRVSSGKPSNIEILDCARRYSGERLYYGRHFPQIAQECEGARSLLDLGCGTGRLLERFACFPNLYRAGIELNPEVAAFARRVSGCEIFECPLEGFRIKRAFDVVTMINVFSHIPSFDAMFASVRSALRPGGKLILRTTEMSSRVSRWNQLHWGIPDDLHFLGLETLEFLRAKYGFAILRHVRTPYEDELFLPSRWQQMGRSRAVNVVKRAGFRLPGLLRVMRAAYAPCLGQRLFISFIVLTPLEERNNGDDFNQN